MVVVDDAIPTPVPLSNAPAPVLPDDLNRTAPLLFEIRVEELPYQEGVTLGEQLARLLTSRLEKTRVDHGNPLVFCTPQRLAVLIPGVREHETAHVREVRGPNAKFAYDGDGHPIAAFRGFAAKNGLTDAPRKARPELNALGVVESVEVIRLVVDAFDSAGPYDQEPAQWAT